MTNAVDTTTLRCPHCGAEPLDDDEQCRFCGEIMSPAPGRMRSCAHVLATGLGALMTKVRPMTAEELDEQEKSLAIFDPANPANPIWDE